MQIFRRFATVATIGATLALSACTTTSPAATGTSHGTSASLVPVTAPAGPASSLQDAFISVVKKVGPEVVQIETSQGLGSGIVFDSQGDIVTNAHVVEGATTFKVTFSDGKVRSGTLVGKYTPDDLAVIHVTATGLTAAHFANSDQLQVGDIVMAIGNPLGLRSSVTEGIVSAVGRNVGEGNGNTLVNALQTSAAINPGNSGGALVDLNGDVVGIPTLAAIDQQLGGAATGIGFAIPSNTVKDIGDQLIASGHVTNSHRAYLGVSIGQLTSGSVVVSAVTAGGPAATAGIVAGDQITTLNSQTVDAVATLTSILAGLEPGKTVPVGITHQDGTNATVQVTLGSYPGG